MLSLFTLTYSRSDLGLWYQIHQKRGRIKSPGDTSTFLTLQHFQNGIKKSDKAMSIPFPLPPRQNLNYVYTLDSAHLNISFWHREEEDEEMGLSLCTRRLSLESIHEASNLSIEALLQNGRNPLLEISMEQNSSPLEKEFENWEIKTQQPSSLNELQYRMFMDFVCQWRFSIDDHTVWQYPLSVLFRRMCNAFLRLAAWDFEISAKCEIAKLPLDAESFPQWDSPYTEIYWFHRFLVVLCKDLRTSPSISTAISRVKEFIGPLEDRGNGFNCILISLQDIAFIQWSSDKIQCSTVFPLLTNFSTTECSAGFRILTYFLTSSYLKGVKRSLAGRQISNLALPPEVLEIIFNAVSPYDIVSFAQASFMVENWYYSSLPQLPKMAICRFGVSIPCCGKRNNGERKEGVNCSDCFAWGHLECLNQKEHSVKERYICYKCRLRSKQAGTRLKLVPGGLSRANRERDRRDGCHVMMWKEEKLLQLRVSAAAFMRPELKLIDRSLSSTPPNQTDYIVLFGGLWSGLAFGLDHI